VREGWQTRPLSELIDIQSGFAFKSQDYTLNGHFLVRIGNVQDGYLSLDNPKYVVLDKKTSRFALREGDLLTSLTGNIGRVAIVEASHLPAALNQRVASVVSH
jgi:type I restriction enzyme, S subunit